MVRKIVLLCSVHSERDGVDREAKTVRISVDGGAEVEVDVCTECDTQLIEPIRELVLEYGQLPETVSRPQPARRSHGQRGDFKCQYCDKPYKYRNSLKEHLRVRHPEQAAQSAPTMDVETLLAERAEGRFRGGTNESSLIRGYPCLLDPLDYVGASGLSTHYRNHHMMWRETLGDLYGTVCPICSEDTKRYGSSHTGEKHSDVLKHVTVPWAFKYAEDELGDPHGIVKARREALLEIEQSRKTAIAQRAEGAPSATGATGS